MRNEGIQNSPEGMQKVDKNDFAEASAGKPAVVAAKARGLFFLPEMSVGEGAAGTGFEVFLEIESTVIVGECERGDQLPGLVSGRVDRLPAVMCSHPLVHVGCRPDIALVRVGKTFQQVDVLHSGGPPSPRLRRAAFAKTPAGLPAEALAKAGGGSGIRTRDTFR